MMQKRKLPRLRNDSPEQSISSEIADLVERTGLSISIQQIGDLTEVIRSNLELGYDKLVNLDREIGGVGLHNVQHPVNGNEMSGNYRIEFRPQFRPIQYVYMHLTFDDLASTSRDIIENSCLHVEYAVKLRFNIPENMNASLGILLNGKSFKQKVHKELDPTLLDLLNRLNRIVYRRAKHTIERVSLDRHKFAPGDAISIYLVCRWIGVKLLEPTGIFGNWMDVK
jgi:hypothetical protein